LKSFTFYCAGLSGVNSGIIASIFSSSAIFSPVFFFLFHDQKMTNFDVAGCAAIVVSVFVIGLFGGGGS